jgi:hypothetical protein
MAIIYNVGFVDGERRPAEGAKMRLIFLLFGTSMVFLGEFVSTAQGAVPATQPGETVLFSRDFGAAGFATVTVSTIDSDLVRESNRSGRWKVGPNMWELDPKPRTLQHYTVRSCIAGACRDLVQFELLQHTDPSSGREVVCFDAAAEGDWLFIGMRYGRNNSLFVLNRTVLLPSFDLASRFCFAVDNDFTRIVSMSINGRAAEGTMSVNLVDAPPGSQPETRTYSLRWHHGLPKFLLRRRGQPPS